MRENKDKVSVIHFEWVTCAVKEKNLPLFGTAGHAANGPACIGISREVLDEKVISIIIILSFLPIIDAAKKPENIQPSWMRASGESNLDCAIRKLSSFS